MWFNKITGQVYVGSSLNKSNRQYSYYWRSKLHSTKKSRIYNSINKYRDSNFSLAILVVCDHKDGKPYLDRETFFIKWAIKIYGDKVLNILTRGGSSMGYTHTSDAKIKMSKLKAGIRNNMYGKNHTEKTRNTISNSMANRISYSVSVSVKKIGSNDEFMFSSIKDAAKYLDTSSTTIKRYLDSGKIYKSLYVISKL